MSERHRRAAGAPAPALADRAAMEPAEAARLEQLFKVLANDTRLRLLHALIRAGDLTVTQLADAVGMRASAVSNQLQRLVDKGVLASRRDGNRIRYRVSDPCVAQLLDVAWCSIDGPGRAPAASST
ncbi:MAG TPA: metalloregulator ArsR/SmtB family transcription factor [Micromonosporaceae bacterium]|nr:metalloregulator ArsR/SmtB family transcription factor [Micromonosporaceae bacterium]